MRSLQSCFGGCDHPLRILDTARRHRAIGEESFGTCQFSPRTVNGDLGLYNVRRQRRVIVAGHPRLEASQYLTGAHYIEKREEIEKYSRALDMLAVDAETPERRRTMLAKRRQEI